MITEFILDCLCQPLEILFYLLSSLLHETGVTFDESLLDGLGHILSGVGYFVPIPLLTLIVSGVLGIYAIKITVFAFHLFSKFNNHGGR